MPEPHGILRNCEFEVASRGSLAPGGEIDVGTRMPASTIAFTIVIVFKSGEFRGRAEIELKGTSPSGKPLPSIKFPVVFEGEGGRPILV